MEHICKGEGNRRRVREEERETMIRTEFQRLREEDLVPKSNTSEDLRVINTDRRPLAFINKALLVNLGYMILKECQGGKSEFKMLRNGWKVKK